MMYRRILIAWPVVTMAALALWAFAGETVNNMVTAYPLAQLKVAQQTLSP